MIDCNNCKHLNVTEKQQTDKKEHHICLKYNKRVFHDSYTIREVTEKLYPCWNCWNDEYINYELR